MERDRKTETVASQLRVGYPTRAGTAKTEILVHEYFEREGKPRMPDTWINESKTKVGSEISFTGISTSTRRRVRGRRSKRIL